MKKKELLELPILELMDGILAHALSKEREKAYVVGDRPSYDTDYYFRGATGNGILQMDIYLMKDIRSSGRLPAYRIFFDRLKPDFITYDMKNEKWRLSRIDNLPGIGLYWHSELYIMQKEQQAVMDYLGLSKLKALEEWQCQIRTKQREESIKRTTDRWDAVMEKIPGLPKDWKTWLAKEAVREHYMFYEYRKSGRMRGRCSRCGKEQTLIKPGYNRMGKCENCRHPVTYKSVGKSGSFFTKDYTAHLVQRMEDRVVSRQFKVRAFYQKGAFYTPQLSLWEERRLILWQDGTAQAYYYGEYKDHKMHWIETEPNPYISRYYVRPSNCSEKGAVYRRTLPALSRRELKKTGISEMVRSQKVISPEVFLLSVKKKPILERIVKAGLATLAADLLQCLGLFELGNSGKLHQCLGIDRDQLKRLRKSQGGLPYLEWLLYEKECGKKIADNVISWFVMEDIKPEDISFVTDRMSPLQIMNYMMKQQKKMGETSISGVLSTWRDYLRMAELSGIHTGDAIVYRASELGKRHDAMVQLREKLKNEEEEREILKQYPSLNETLASLKGKYDYQDKTYAVVVPECVTDLLHEGKVLQHCMNRTDHYYERIVKRESYILFLRKADALTVPYYTLEVEPGGNIRQTRTEYNRQKDDIAEVTKFLQKWQKEIAKRMTEADWKMADTSRKLRQEEYAQLRRNHVRIGGGTYDGQLLADILEADMMEMPDAA